MNRRLFFLFAALFLVAGLLYFLQDRRPSTISPEGVPELAAYAPPEAAVLVYVDVAQMRQSKFLVQLVAELGPAPPADEEYKEFVRATGFDYSRDLDRLLFALLPGKTPSGHPRALFVFEGRFDRARITSYAMKSGRKEQYGAQEILVLVEENPRREGFLAFLSNSRIAATLSPDLVPLLARNELPPLPDDLKRRIARVGGSAIFAVSRVERSGPRSEVRVFGWSSRDFHDLLQQLEWISIAARPDGEKLKVALEAECITPENAEEAARQLKAALVLGRLLLSDSKLRNEIPPQSLAFLDFLVREGDVRQSERLLQIRLDVPPDVLRQAARTGR